MDYLGDKLNSWTGEAMTGINELKRKRQARRQRTAEPKQLEETALDAALSMPASQPAVQQQTTTAAAPTASLYGFDLSRIKQGPLSGGVAFGGDSSTSRFQPPPVGFKPLLTDNEDDAADKTRPSAPLKRDDPKKEAAPAAEYDEGSSLSLYEGDTWSRMWFQRVMILTLIRLLLFVRKVYEDFFAFKIYRQLGHTGHWLISAATLFLPTIVFTIYRIARYLQVALPAVRTPANGNDPASDAEQPRQSADHSSSKKQHSSSRDADDAQSRRALMTSSPADDSVTQPSSRQQPPTSSVEPAQGQSEAEDGLATARQTPTNFSEEFHDTKSEEQFGSSQLAGQDSKQTGGDSRRAVDEISTTRSREPKLESVDVSKLGNIPDKQTTRIVLGASEQLLHGLLFIFWQLKRQVDVVGYLVERSCLWRRPKETEMQQLGRLRFGGDGLEWFQHFYAAFLAILVQVYSLSVHWANDNGTAAKHQNITTDELRKLSGVLDPTTVGYLSARPGESAEGSAGIGARALSGLFGQYIITSGGDLLIMSEILVSCMAVVSLLFAVRRQDDGPMTLALSMLGWGSIFAARIIAVALAFVHIGWQIMLALVVIHIAAISAWIYKIAIDSHNGNPEESEEHCWNPDVIEEAPSQQLNQDEKLASQAAAAVGLTSSWSKVEHLTLICQVITLFAIPSLFYWPIMFNLKLHARPFKYLALILSQNFLLIAAIWYQVSSQTSTSAAQWYLLGTVGACSIVGFIFIALYIACKPNLTEYFARADEIINGAEKCGIYFEFCSRVFKLPDLTKHAFTRLMDQQERIVIEQEEVESKSGAKTEIQLD